MRCSTQLATAVLALAASGAVAMPPGDVVAGRRIAEANCISCHAVSDWPGKRGADVAPPFASIANDPARTEMWLRVFLQTPHRRMPDLVMTNREIDDVISYIGSLRRD
ncbi:MAG TPA: cytochrome c [Alphaproteobacteria bacterium]|nr:cytochrome c [Alphaproteobacteria bacterium]